MTDILMPKLSDSMEEGAILSWLQEPGAHVTAGQELLEIETDKSTVTYAAEASGVLEILVAEGTTVAVGEPIARVGERAEAAAADQAVGPTVPDSVRSNYRGQSQPAPDPAGLPAVAAPIAPARKNGAPGRIATPLARRAAEVHGVGLADVHGTGPLGRITRSDVLRAAGIEPVASIHAVTTPPAEPPPTSAALVTDPEPGRSLAGSTRQDLTRLQLVIARRMAEAKANVPHFQVQTEVVMGAAITLRAELKALAGEADSVPSVNDFIIKAAAVALRDHPLANGSFRDAAFELHESVHVGVAVAAEGALVVPTVFDADTKSLGQIARESRRLAGRVRDGSIAPAELEGGTFTVSNLGMFGMTAITPVINPPQAAILGVGAMRPHLVRWDGEIVEQALITLTLSCDHRILYGADAARFLARIRELLEAPLKLAL
jgi:pyruvate dehydrogenase E2 component (dihydrolipoamide acetyltransferase)